MRNWFPDILSSKIVSGSWAPGNIVRLEPDIIVAHDIAFPSAAGTFERLGGKRVRNREKVFVVFDHLQPAKDIASADIAEKTRTFAREQDIINVFHPGRAGILTVALDEFTQLRPGMLIAGTDTHMTSYGAFGILSVCIGPSDFADVMHSGSFWFEAPRTVLVTVEGKLSSYVGGRDVGLRLLKEIGLDGALGEFILVQGPVVDEMSICGRRQLCNLINEAGAVGALMNPDEKVASYLGMSVTELPDFGNLECDRTYVLDMTNIGPQVAHPGRQDDVNAVNVIADTPIDVVFIGSCAGGSIEDLEAVDKVLAENEISANVRMIVVPQSAGTYRKAEEEGILGRIVAKGAYVAGPGCGPCMGAHLGVLGRNEVCVSTSPRNFAGRMGSRKAQIYLANAWVAASSAVAGKIVHPGEVLTEG